MSMWTREFLDEASASPPKRTVALIHVEYCGYSFDLCQVHDEDRNLLRVCNHSDLDIEFSEPVEFPLREPPIPSRRRLRRIPSPEVSSDESEYSQNGWLLDPEPHQLRARASYRFNVRECRRRNFVKRQRISQMRAQAEDDEDVFVDAPESPVPQRNTYELLNDLAETVQNHFPSNISETVFVHLERVVLLGVGLTSSNNFANALSLIGLFVGHYAEKGTSLCTQYTELVRSLFGISAQAEDSVWSGVGLNWKLFCEHEKAKDFAFVLGTAIAIGTCKISNITFMPKIFELCRDHALNETLNAPDFISACINLFCWCSDTFTACSEQNSLLPALYPDSAVQAMSTTYYKWFPRLELIITGNFAYEGERNDALKDMLELRTRLQHLLCSSKIGTAGVRFSDMLFKVTNFINALAAQDRNAGIRMAPIGIHLFGPPKSGKSFMTNEVLRRAMAGFKRHFDPAKKVMVKVEDKFDSTMTSDKECVVIDDVCAIPVEKQTVPLAGFLIDMVNNAPVQAVKAEIEQKSSVWYNHLVTLLTSNQKDLNAAQISQEPGALLRRFLHCTVRVKKEYATVSGQINNAHPIFQGNEEFPDAWDIDIELAEGNFTTIPVSGGNQRRKNEHKNFTFKSFDVRLLNGETVHTRNLSVQQFFQAITALSREHKADQDRLLNLSRKSGETKLCFDCGMPSCVCKTCSISTAPGRLSLPQIPEDISVDASGFDQSSKSPSLLSNHFDVRPPADLDDVSTLPSADFHSENTVEEWFLNKVFNLGSWWYGKYWNDYTRWFFYSGSKKVESLVESEIRKELLRLSDFTLSQTSMIIPDFIWENRRVQRCFRRYFLWRDLNEYIVCSTRELLLYPFRTFLFWIVFCYSFLHCFNPSFWYACLECAILPWILLFVWRLGAQVYTIESRRRALNDRIDQNRQLHSAIIRHPFVSTAMTVACGVGLAASIALFLKMWWNSISRVPQDLDGNPNRDSQPGWMGNLVESFYSSSKPQKSTNGGCNQMSDSLGKNIVPVRIKKGNVSSWVNAVFLETGYALINRHAFFEKSDITGNYYPEVEITFYRQPRKDKDRGDLSGTIFKRVIRFDDCERIGDTDCMVVPMTSCDFVDRTGMLPRSIGNGKMGCRMIVWKKESEDPPMYKWCDERFIAKQSAVLIPGMSSRIDGLEYTTSLARDGACGGIVLTDRHDPCIAGFHFGGCSITNRGIAQTILHSEYTEAVGRIRQRNPTLVANAAEGEVPEEQYGERIMVSEGAHRLATEFWTHTGEESLEVLGSTRLRAKFKSEVVPSSICEHVKSVCGVENAFGPPNFEPNWERYNETLRKIADGPKDIDSDLLRKAFDDYLLGVPEALSKWELVRPLTDQEAIDGIPGKKFIDRINLSTSMGFPVFGSKRRHVIEEEIDGKIFTTLSDDIIHEMDRMMTCWKAGKRAYPVFCATLKDEPTKIGKKKVRVFQACPIAYTIHIRKYFLPLVRFIQMHPLLMESAVGLNCQGPDWEELMTHVEEFGQDGRGVGWDYESYDTKQPANVLQAAWKVMIEIARLAGYSESDLSLMETMSTDATHALIDWNGTMIQTSCVNTSGNPITVIINGILNCLLMRSFYMSLSINSPFRENVRMTTYGDDAEGTVKKSIRDKFNFQNYKLFLATYGVGITPPDKSDGVVCDFPLDELDFLKRTSCFIPELGIRMGALKEQSIFKGIMNSMTPHRIEISPGCYEMQTLDDVAVSSLNSAMYGWVAHGKEVYEHRRKQMIEVCKRANIVCAGVDTPWETRMQQWKDEYETPREGNRDQVVPDHASRVDGTHQST